MGWSAGAVPIVLATFPLLANVPNSQMIFNLVFFIVVTSTIIQGPSIPLVAKWLKLDIPFTKKTRMPIEVEPSDKMKSDLLDIIVPKGSNVIGKQIKDLNLLEGVLIILINRGDEFFVPTGSTILQEADMLLALADKKSAPIINAIIDEIR